MTIERSDQAAIGPSARDAGLMPELAALIGAIDAARDPHGGNPASAAAPGGSSSDRDGPSAASEQTLPIELVAYIMEDATATDEPFRPPSTWKLPAPVAPPRRAVAAAAGIGVAIGLASSIGALGLAHALTSGGPEGLDRDNALRLVREATAHAGRLSPGPILAEARLELAAARTLSRPVFEPELDEARRRIDAGDILGARDALATAAAARSPRALFAMAETYDPNLLAAWGIRGVAADAERARALYTASLLLGHDAAEARLDTLR